MDEDVAKLIFFTIMAVGVIVWAVSLWQALRLGRSAPRSKADFNDDGHSSPFEWQSGRITLRGNREAVSKAVVRSLLQLYFGMVASIFKIQQYEDGRVVLEKFGSLVCNLPPGLYSPKRRSLSKTRVPERWKSCIGWATVGWSAGSGQSHWP